MIWWHRLRHGAELEQQLDKELRFHLEQHASDLMARGVAPEEAQRQARLAMGGPEQVKEGCRDARGTRWLEELRQDTRYALRMLRQRPGFAAVALCTLALGIGAATVMFSVIDGVLLKPLPYPAPHRLLLVQEKTDWSTHWGDLWSFTYPNFTDCRDGVHALDMAGWRFGGGTVTKPGDAEAVEGREVSANLFAVLGVPMFRGRTFAPVEDRPGGAPVAIVSYRLWQRRFAGDEAAIGRQLVLNGKSYSVVGITPPGFRLMTSEFDVFTPLGQDTARYMQNREAHGLRVVARLHAGATAAEARGELAAVGRRLAAEYSKSNRGRTFIADALKPPVDDVKNTLWLLLGAVGLVLLIGCVNIAGLLTARAVSRERELAMRVALGAGRARLIRQCLTESAVLGLAGGALGIALAAAGLRPFVAFWPGSLPRAEEVGLDGRVLLFAAAVSLGCGVLFGLAPALRVPVAALASRLHGGARAVGGTARLHGSFVIAEIALAVVLLVAAGMLGRTLLRLASLDPGVNVHNVLTARAALAPGTLADAGRTRAAWRDLLERVRGVPGVQSAAIVDTVPMREGNNQIGYRTSAAAVPPDRQPLTSATSVTPDYLKVMGIPLREGRFFTEQDRVGSESVAVIDEVMAREAFGSQSAIGKYVWIELGDDPRRVIGVVGHVRHWGPADDDRGQVRAQLYYPLAQVPDALMRRWSELMSVAVRTGVDPLSVVEPVRRAVRGTGGDQVIYEVRTMEDLAASAVGLQRFLMLVFGIFAGLALILAAIGIYGLLAYVTSRRVPEFGVRIAMGASGRDVMRLVFRQTAAMLAAGVGLGLGAAFAASRLLERLVTGVRPGDPGTAVAMVAVLVGAALAATFVPARRAARVDPMAALRAD
jgi:predicted permease